MVMGSILGLKLVQEVQAMEQQHKQQQQQKTRTATATMVHHLVFHQIPVFPTSVPCKKFILKLLNFLCPITPKNPYSPR